LAVAPPSLASQLLQIAFGLIDRFQMRDLVVIMREKTFIVL
jgi:hypothetical protein